MTDKELIEMAAQAAGLSILGWYQDGTPLVAGAGAYKWDPLKRDKDAFRLAARSGLRVTICTLCVGVSQKGDDGVFSPVHWETFEEFEESIDSGKIVRRAIVTAAAKKALGDEIYSPYLG